MKTRGGFVLGNIDSYNIEEIPDSKRLLRLLTWLKEEFVLALTERGIETFSGMISGKKVILNKANIVSLRAH